MNEILRDFQSPITKFDENSENLESHSVKINFKTIKGDSWPLTYITGRKNIYYVLSKIIPKKGKKSESLFLNSGDFCKYPMPTILLPPEIKKKSDFFLNQCRVDFPEKKFFILPQLGSAEVFFLFVIFN